MKTLKSLLPDNIWWVLFIFVFPFLLNINIWSTLAVCLFNYTFYAFLVSLHHVYSIKFLMLFTLQLKMTIMPVVVYNALDNNAHYKMVIEENEYMSVAFPMLFSLFLGIMFTFRNIATEINISNNIKSGFLKIENKSFVIGITLILVSFAAKYLAFIVPSSLGFVFFLLAQLRFIGIFFILFSNNPFKWIWISVVYLTFALEIFRGGMFYELFVWSLLLFIVWSIRYNPTIVFRVAVIVLGVLGIFIIQNVKHEYRKIISNQKNESSGKSNEAVFIDLVKDRVIDDDDSKSTNKLDRVVSRVNQGWIFAMVIDNLKKNQLFSNGEQLKSEISAVVLPRFLMPSKKSVGGEDNREKFELYTGRRLLKSTIMRIDFLADVYVNFGFKYSLFFIFLYGFLIGLLINWFIKQASKRAFWFFLMIFIFSYQIRWSDIFVVVNHLVKALFLSWVLAKIYFNAHFTEGNIASQKTID